MSQRVTYRSNRKGDVVSKETRRYDRFGRLAETRAGFGSTVTYLYDGLGRLSRQTVDDSPIEYAYTRCGQLAGKFLGGRANPDAAVEYEYADNGRIVARTANGVRQTFAYDKKGQLVAVRDADGKDVERYAYDKAGNMLRKTVNGKTTTFAFDRANQLVSSTCGGITTHYEYDAAGRLVKEGDKTYTYGYLDKVMAVTDGAKNYSYSYHPDGQLARANYGDTSESFLWDGLALIQRGDEQFVNEPHVGGGNPVASSKKATYFNDLLGTTVGQKTGNAYTAAALSAFGEPLPNAQPSTPNAQPFFTGKPQVEGLGYAFLMRNYRAGLAKWQTVDPMGYPDGWNQLAYCGNGVMSAVDLRGCATETVVSFGWFWEWEGEVAIANGTPLDLPLTIPSVSPSVFNNLATIIGQYLQNRIVDLKPLWDAFQITRYEQGCGPVDDIELIAQQQAEVKAAELFDDVISVEVTDVEFLKVVNIMVENDDKLIWYRHMKVLYLVHMKVVTE